MDKRKTLGKHYSPRFYSLLKSPFIPSLDDLVVLHASEIDAGTYECLARNNAGTHLDNSIAVMAGEFFSFIFIFISIKHEIFFMP